MGQYLPIVALLVLSVGFGVFSFLLTKILAPRRPTVAKELPYECGIVPTQEPPERFPVRFYLVAMIFIVFDIEIIFIYPYTVAYRELGVFGLVDMIVFAVSVFVAFIFLIANGALDWGPIKRLRRSDFQVSADRTAEATVRRVGAGSGEEVAA